MKSIKGFELEAKSKRELPVLRRYLDRLLGLLTDALSSDLSHHTSPHFPFLVFNLACKQLTHVKSLIVLADAGQDRDTVLIARAMSECLVLELWASKQPEERAWLWRAYALVHDYRLLQKKKSAGIPVSAEDSERITRRALAEAGALLRKNARAALANGKPMPDNPFQFKWHVDATGRPLQVRELFEDAGLGDAYQLYSGFSDWVHSNAVAFGTAVQWEGRTHTYQHSWPPDVAASFAVAATALAHSIELLVDTFKLPPTLRPRELWQNLEAELSALSGGSA
jgi:hypothetical protein